MPIELRQVRDIVKGNFWKPADELGAHVLYRSAELITNGLTVLDPDLPQRQGGEVQVMDTVLHEVLTTPSPDDLLPGAIDLAVDALQHKEPFYLWTAGHHGTYKPGTEDELPGYSNQARKFAGSGFRKSVEQGLMDRGYTAKKARKLRRKYLRPRVGKTEKFSRLDRTSDKKAIFDELRDEGRTEAFILDDRQGNLDTAQQTVASYNLKNGYKKPIELYSIKVQPEHGMVADIAGYHKAVKNFRRNNWFKRRRLAHIVDWDDTLFNEQQRVERIGYNLHAYFYPSE